MDEWHWRKASGGWTLPTDDTSYRRLFHAYDESNHAACSPGFGLNASCEEPNEGSQFCPVCMGVVLTRAESQFSR